MLTFGIGEGAEGDGEKASGPPFPRRRSPGYRLAWLPPLCSISWSNACAMASTWSARTPETRERRHAANRGDALWLDLEHHQIERVLTVAARAPEHEEGRGDAFELTGRDIGTRMVFHALDGALDLGRLHRHRHPEALRRRNGRTLPPVPLHR